MGKLQVGAGRKQKHQRKGTKPTFCFSSAAYWYKEGDWNVLVEQIAVKNKGVFQEVS